MSLTLPAASSLLSLFADPTRVRLVSLLARDELSVAELTRILGVPQSRVSTHLGKLRDAGLVVDRRSGTSSFYRLTEVMPSEARRVWELLASELADGVLASDRDRSSSVVASRAQRWPDAVAGQMEHHYSPGRTWEATARGFLGLLQLGDLLDAGSGDGTVAALLAPHARSVTCLDRSERVLAAAERRLGEMPNVRFAHGDLLELPFDEATFDEVILFNVLTCAEDPARAVMETARVLRPGGRLAGVTLRAHSHPEITAAYGHLVAGFEPGELRALLEGAGLGVDRCDVTSRERRPPHFEVLSFFAHRPGAH
ncbi:MAG: metalloregulator ArsR/SmtB family transcription factor [Sandaracinaceae bacterium]